MKYVVSLFIITGFLLAPLSKAEESTTIKIGCSVSTPPFVIRENDRGILLDTLRETFLLKNINVHFSYAGNAENFSEFNRGNLDALCTSTQALTPSAWLSKHPIVTYQNVAVSLKSRELNLLSVNDFKNLKVAGFNHARAMLTPEFEAFAQQSASYFETTEQQQQVLALFLGDVDVIVMEQTLFRYFLSRLRHSEPHNYLLHFPYTITHLFPQSVYYVAFNNEQLRDHFDQALDLMLANGSVETIKRNYAALLSDYLFQ